MVKQWKQCQTLFWGGSKITADGDCSHEIKRHLLLGRKVMTNLDSMQDTGCLGLVHWDDPERWYGEGSSGLRTHVHPWQIHVDVWQNQYSIIK